MEMGHICFPHANNSLAVSFFSPLLPSVRPGERSIDLWTLQEFLEKNRVPQPTRKEGERQFYWDIWMEKKRENFKLPQTLKYLVLVLGT